MLEGIWTEEKTIQMQRRVLEKMTEELVGTISSTKIKKQVIDTTYLSKEEVVDAFYEALRDSIERE